MSTPVVRMQGISIGYSETSVISGLSFELRTGEAVALTGPNGCGKTTLVRGILGLLPVHGEFEIFGHSVTGPRRRTRRFEQSPTRIGYVPQRHTVGGAIPSTVREVTTSGRLPGKPWYAPMNATDRAAVSAAIEMVGLSAQADVDVATLSGGQQRRCLIARALAAQPKVLVMDEPTAGVDPESQRSLAITLARLREAGLTLLIVTHELAPLVQIVTRVVSMEQGRIISDQPAPEPAPEPVTGPAPEPAPENEQSANA